MAESQVKKVVFLVSPRNDKRQLEGIKKATLNFLFQFHKENRKSSHHFSALIGESVKWSYKFLEKSRKNYSLVQEWNELSHSEFEVFEKRLEELNSNSNEIGSETYHGAHYLSETLKSIVHDYCWDDFGLVSPVKKPSKRSSYSRNCTGHVEMAEKFSCNIVAIICPLPKSQRDLDDFFDRPNTNEDHVCRKLMPSDLRIYFREKYNISLIWIDTSDQIRCDIQGNKSDGIAANTIKSFLRSLGGDVLPLSVLSREATGINLAEEIGCYPFLHTAKDFSNFKDSKKCLSIHVAESTTNPDRSLKVQKQFSLQSQNMSSTHYKWIGQLTDHSCQHCVEDIENGTTASHSLRISEDKSQLRVTLNKTYCDRFVKSNADPSPENVLMILGKFRRDQLPQVLDHKNVVEFCSIWCKVSWSSCYDPHRWNGCLVTEVHKYCTKCCRESPLEYIGIKYAIIDMKAKGLASVTYVRLKSTSLLNPGCWVPYQSNYSATSPMKGMAVKKENHTQSPSEQDLLKFCPSMVEDWWLMKPTSDVLLQNFKMVKEKTTAPSGNKLMEDLKRYYENKADHLKENYKAQVAETETFQQDLMQGIEPLDDSSASLSLKDEFLASIERLTFPDLSTVQVDGLIRAANSLFTSARSSMLVTAPTWNEFCEKLEELQCFCSVQNIKKLQAKEQTQMSIMQVMMILKYVECYSQERDPSDFIDDISRHLRSISVTSGHSVMTKFVGRVLVEKFYGVCGKLLYEVHNELMLRIPEVLEKYAKEEEDTTFSDSVLWSANSYNSLPSNTSISRSCGTTDLKSRRQRFVTSSVSQLRKIIEIPSQPVDDKKQTQRPTREKTCSESSSKGKGIIRDLFSVQDEASSEKPVFESPDPKRQPRIFVRETPKVKQRMTAFKRQSLRMQKQHANGEELNNVTVIEESPAKDEDTKIIFNDPKSLKLTRRHSFYCDGKDSRSVTRAKSLTQHQQGVLSTPVIAGKVVKKEHSPKIGRRSLTSLFHSPRKSVSDFCFAAIPEDSAIEPPADRSQSMPKSRLRPLRSLFRSPVKANSPRQFSALGNENSGLTAVSEMPSLASLFQSPVNAAAHGDVPEIAESLSGSSSLCVNTSDLSDAFSPPSESYQCRSENVPFGLSHNNPNNVLVNGPSQERPQNVSHSEPVSPNVIDDVTRRVRRSSRKRTYSGQYVC